MSSYSPDLEYRQLIEQYKTCNTADEVAAMQEKILEDLETSYEKSRETSGMLVNAYRSPY